MEFERFVKKPVEVSAIQWTPYNYTDVMRFLGKDKDRIEVHAFQYNGLAVDEVHLVIPTLEGYMRVNVGDWIIRDIKGELYPCKNDIFEKTYARKNNDTSKTEKEPPKTVINNTYLCAADIAWGQVTKVIEDIMAIGNVSVGVTVDREEVVFNVYPCPYPIDDKKE